MRRRDLVADGSKDPGGEDGAYLSPRAAPSLRQGQENTKPQSTATGPGALVRADDAPVKPSRGASISPVVRSLLPVLWAPENAVLTFYRLSQGFSNGIILADSHYQMFLSMAD